MPTNNGGVKVLFGLEMMSVSSDMGTHTSVATPCMCTQLLCIQSYNIFKILVIYYNINNKMKKEVGMLLQKRTDTSAVGIYKLYEENTH